MNDVKYLSYGAFILKLTFNKDTLVIVNIDKLPFVTNNLKMAIDHIDNKMKEESGVKYEL